MGFFCFCFVLGWCCAVIPRRAGKVSDLWRPQEEAVRFSPNHRSTVGDFGHQQQSTVGSGGWWNVFPKYNPSPCQLNADPWYRNNASFTLNAVSFLITRWCTMTHAEEAQAIGTVCSGLSIWPLGAIWLQRWVRCVSVDYTLFFSLRFTNLDKHSISELATIIKHQETSNLQSFSCTTIATQSILGKMKTKGNKITWK